MPLLPHIANFDDLDPLAAEPDVDVVMVKPGHPLPVCDLIVCRGRRRPSPTLARSARKAGTSTLPRMCGAEAMCLGSAAAIRCWDADDRRSARHRGREGSVPGLGLLQVDTVIEGEKTLAEVSGTTLADAAPVKGYEMHMGVTTGADTARPLVRFRDGRADGAISA